ncbi:MAG TPA: hypothetical protein VGR35_01345 [Tepidisphaeraceae bacterium]|nr:hypothetical protein [Tepidisphaeraceae bacterium]
MKYRDRLRVWESGYGRSDGWDVELDGKPVAFMDEPQWEEMFWVSYRLTPTTDDPSLKERLLSESFWGANSDEWSKLVFRSRATGLVAENAFPSIKPFVGPQRVNMRALYIAIGHPFPWDWIVLKVRSLMRRSARAS